MWPVAWVVSGPHEACHDDPVAGLSGDMCLGTRLPSCAADSQCEASELASSAAAGFLPLSDLGEELAAPRYLFTAFFMGMERGQRYRQRTSMTCVYGGLPGY